MKIVFQDIDGVLNNYDVIYRASRADKENDLSWNISEEHIEKLNRLVESTGAILVITSTWRKFHEVMEFREVFKAKGFSGKILSCTPVLTKSNGRSEERGVEIQSFLEGIKDYHDVESFVILDDDSDMGDLKDFLVKTSMETGLTDEHVDEAIAKLNVTETNVNREEQASSSQDCCNP